MNPRAMLRHRILLVLEAASPRPVSQSLITRIVSDVELALTPAGVSAALKEMAQSGMVEATGEKHDSWRLSERFLHTKHAAAVDAAIAEALASGAITQATESYHRASCKTPDDLIRFQAFAATSVLRHGGDTSAEPLQLNDEEKAVCLACEISYRDFVNARDGGGR